MQLTKLLSLLLLLFLLTVARVVTAECTAKKYKEIDIPAPTITITNSDPVGKVLATIDIPRINSTDIYAECDQAGGTLRYISYEQYDQYCASYAGGCYPALKDAKGRWIYGIGIKIIDERGNTYLDGVNGTTLPPNAQPRFNELSPLTIQIIKIRPTIGILTPQTILPISTGAVQTSRKVALRIEIVKGGRTYTTVRYMLGGTTVNVENRCQLTYSPNVSLGSIDVASLKKTGSSPNSAFTLRLDNCPDQLVKFTIQNANPINAEQGVLRNIADQNAAQNVGVQILDSQNQQPFPLNHATTLGRSSSFSIPLNARMYKTGANVSVGRVNAMATLLISYE